MTELFRRLAASPFLLGELLLASLFVNILGLASTLYVIQVLNRYVSYGVDATLVTLTVGVVIAALLEFGFRLARMKLAAAIGSGPDAQAGDVAYRVLLQARVGALDRIASGLRQEIARNVDSVERAFTAPTVTAVLDVPFALLFMVTLLALSPLLAGIVAVSSALTLYLVVAAQKAMQAPTRAMTDAAANTQSLLTAAVEGADTTRAFNGSGMLFRLWDRQRGVLRSLRRRLADAEGLNQSLVAGIANFQGIAIIAVGATLVVEGTLDVATLIGANILAARALGPIARMGTLSETITKGTQALKLLRDFAQLPLEPESGSALNPYRGKLELKDLAFLYPGGAGPLFESLSLTLEPGMVLAVTGPNGSGKTTLARMLVGLIDPMRGQILVDGVDLRQVAPEWWRRQVVYQPQEPVFLPGTIAENIRLNAPALDGEGLNRVIQAVGLRPFIDTAPKGFETPITDGGRHLSLGVRRRIALARALASGGGLVVLDEPTEGLDAEGCAAVLAVMNALGASGRTIVAVSHDPQIVQRAHLLLDLGSKPVPRVARVVHSPGKETPHV
ncbi:MAG: ATP-binding cassette domain-containing protein [Alphaproteobacteria bacterium]|nr:ATP-binding cassette domain-containing protein [Alphaproteobacteria bacterium]